MHGDQVATRMAMFCDCMVIRLQRMSTGHTVMKIDRVVNRDFRRNSIGNITVIPMKEA